MITLFEKFGGCVISFVDEYKKNAKNCVNNLKEYERIQMDDIAQRFSEIAKRYNVKN